MKRFVSVSQLAAVLLYIPLVQVFTILGNSHSRVMLFPEAWGRSQCCSLERMVEVEQEYPGGVEHIYSPGCVPLLRCSGCGNDDKLSCFPVSTRNISIQLLRMTPAERQGEYVLLSFQEHQSCECRPRTTSGPETAVGYRRTALMLLCGKDLTLFSAGGGRGKRRKEDGTGDETTDGGQGME
ncbi:placenta growth factor-like [Cyprinus carpio]|uniref:Placenta growth factor-like n=1 Tax=Cyprinus carpio TaxID=7962 RepID=A0A9Q9Y1D4_CYPCA|nr:placenta growth factor-like [Cyprinus carpio]